MLVYFFGTLFSMLFALCSSKVKYSKLLAHRSKRIYYIIFCVFSFFPLTIISSFRYNVGTDYQSYVGIFNYNINIEYGFSLLIRFLHIITDNPMVFFVLSSTIIMIGYYFIIFKESINPALSILLFVINYDFFKSMNIIRQYMAISVILMSLPQIKNKNWKVVIPTIFLAMLIHKSAVFFLLIIILDNLNCLSFRVVFVSFITAFLFSKYLIRIVILVLRTLGIYYQYFELAPSTDYSYLTYILLFLMVFLGFVICGKRILVNRNMHLCYAATVTGLIISAATPIMPDVAERVTLYSNAVLIVYLPEVFQNIHDKRMQFFFKILVIIVLILIMSVKLYYNTADVLPYQSFLQ